MLKDNIKDLRQSKSLTQKELASYLNLSQQAIGKWEKGVAEPDSATLCKLSDFFNVSVDYLLGRAELRSPVETKTAPTVSGEGVTDEDIKFALFDGDGEITDEMFEEVKRFAKYVQMREREKKN